MQEEAEWDTDGEAEVFGFVAAEGHGQPAADCTAKEAPPKEGGLGNAIFMSNSQKFIDGKEHECQEVNCKNNDDEADCGGKIHGGYFLGLLGM